MTSKSESDKVTFQVTVTHLTTSSQLPKKDIRVTVGIGDVSKITCAGELSENGLTVRWNHPFLFTTFPSAPVRISICILPEELTPEWDKEPLGGQIVINVADLLRVGNEWKCDIPGQLAGVGTLSMICRACDMLVIPNGHNCTSALQKYDRRLWKLGENFNNLSCLLTQIELGWARLDLCPLGHEDHLSILGDLAMSFESCYVQENDILDLNKAIEIEQRRLDLCPLGHPQHIKVFGGLAISLWKHYQIQQSPTDLNNLIQMQEKWLEMCPIGHSAHALASGELALALCERYSKQGNIADLDRSIELGERRLVLCPLDSPGHETALNNLAASLIARYRRLSDLADLNRAIDLQENCLKLHPTGHPYHGVSLRNLALSLYNHYERTANHSDLDRAIKLFKEALYVYPSYHHNYAFNAGELAAMILLSCKKLLHRDHQSPPQADEAFETYRLLKKCSPAVSLELLDATQEWVKNAEKYDHSSILEAYQTSLNTLDHFAALSSSIDSRHETMQAKVKQLANDAFSCAIRHGDLRKAVELLEQGRGILWNQLARFDISVAVLEGQGDKGHELAQKFTRLSAELRKHAQGGGGGTGLYWQAQREWRSVVDDIRRIDGFSQFLLPLRFEDLQHAAEGGPVIIVNASEYTCDALILLRTREPVHVELPCSLPDINQLCSQLSVLTRDPFAYGKKREFWVMQMLRELWSTAVEPIITTLQDDIQLPAGSRIWWCPTSKFTILPFHAAGPYQRGKKNLMDIYVSSYAPSLSALIRARERVRLQKAARDVSGSGSANVISFAAVGQGQPSAEIKLGELPEVGHEIQRIRNETHMPEHVQFEAVTGREATIEGAVQAFRDHRWVHVACHGAQDVEKPFESWFAMGDGKLTLMRIIQERYTNSEFAFLSACHTAVGDKFTPDEVLHLAAGMQFAGFNGVIGTLWRVDDSEAHRVVTRFYREMFGRADIGFEHAATALNTTVVESVNEVALEKRIVFVHIGI